MHSTPFSTPCQCWRFPDHLGRPIRHQESLRLRFHYSSAQFRDLRWRIRHLCCPLTRRFFIRTVRSTLFSLRFSVPELTSLLPLSPDPYIKHWLESSSSSSSEAKEFVFLSALPASPPAHSFPSSGRSSVPSNPSLQRVSRPVSNPSLDHRRSKRPAVQFQPHFEVEQDRQGGELLRRSTRASSSSWFRNITGDD